jgi:hypothetical protein
MPDMNREQLHTLARLGAQARLIQLDAEIAAIRAAYPESTGQIAKRGRKPGRKPAAAAGSVEKPAATRPRKRYRMSAEAKKVVSERMKRYWAERRKAKEQQAPVAAVEAAEVKPSKPRGAGRRRKAAERGRRAKR